MKYLNFVAADGRPAREDVAVMQHYVSATASRW